MKQYICQYKVKELLIVFENDLIKEMKAKIEVVIQEEVEGKSSIGYLTKTEPLTLKEKFNIYQMTD